MKLLINSNDEKKIDEKKKELNDLSNKFKQLKSLVYEYKDIKEKEEKSLLGGK